jgi:hypothetical protein
LIISWRNNGILTSRPTSSTTKAVSQHLANLPSVVVNFCHTYRSLERINVAENFKAITHRCRMVDFWKMYIKAESVSIDREPRLESGQTKQAQRIRFLFDLLYQSYQGIKDVQTNPISKHDWVAFTNQLKWANRWYDIREEFGYGIPGLIPERIVSKTFIQRGLQGPTFELWIRAVKHFNPGCTRAAQNWSKM